MRSAAASTPFSAFNADYGQDRLLLYTCKKIHLLCRQHHHRLSAPRPGFRRSKPDRCNPGTESRGQGSSAVYSFAVEAVNAQGSDFSKAQRQCVSRRRGHELFQITRRHGPTEPRCRLREGLDATVRPKRGGECSKWYVEVKSSCRGL